MKKLLVILLVLAGTGVILWSNWGAQLSQLASRVTSQMTDLLTGIVPSLSSFGSAVSDSFRSMVR